MSNLLLQTDVYKFNHAEQYPPGINKVYSYLEARGTRHPGMDYTVFFGLQYYLKKFLENPITHEDVEEFGEVTRGILGENAPDLSRFYALADLGYLPIEIKAIPEGTIVPIKNALLTMTNTHPDFAWLVNYLETLLMKIWSPITVASNSLRFRRLFENFARQTCDNTGHVAYQMHDFGYRGVSSEESAGLAGGAHLLSFMGTDTTAGVVMLRDYYEGDINHIGHSVAASEHSVMCAWSDENDDREAIKNMLERYPSGIVSIVSDSYDLWRTITDYYGGEFKDTIMARQGKTVVRPDSGDPVKIICGDPSGETEEERLGVIRLLDNYFGSTANSRGYRELDPHIGVIYGDAIFYERAEEILGRLAAMGYASNNIVFGSGGLLLNGWSRDTLGMAIKATYCEVDGESRPIEKAPKTDTGKKSRRGLIKLEREVSAHGPVWKTLDNQENEDGGELVTVFKDGEIFGSPTLDEIRARVVAENEIACHV